MGKIVFNYEVWDAGDFEYFFVTLQIVSLAIRGDAFTRINL